MIDYLWLIPVLPLAASLILIFFGGNFPRVMAASIGCGFMGLTALLAIGIAFSFFGGLPEQNAVSVSLGTWFSVGEFQPGFGLHLDALSMLMTLVITIIGFLIFFYSTEYMAEDTDFSRFFAYMNLFAFSMLTLVLADNFILLILGWEGVGLCSYLLIGFWYKNPANGYAARKAFITTRIGAVGLIIGAVLIFRTTGLTNIQDVMAFILEGNIDSATATANAMAVLLLIAALGKSAQLPLQVWLPDAMAGPTPTSALIHAATMVTAGVYLIARTHVLFELAPGVMAVVAALGTATMLIAGSAALAQSDIKRVLAYSTISQIGYMFMALGVGAWTAAMFHFYTHAVFKALLFLGAGTIIHAVHGEQNMFRMGGLRKEFPGVFYPFLLGSMALAGVPLITAGFYSKDLILWKAYISEAGSLWIVAAGLIGALITAAYTFRMVFVTFFGEAKTKVSHKPGPIMLAVLGVLGVGAVIAGFIETPHYLGYIQVFSDFVGTAVQDVTTKDIPYWHELVLTGIAVLLVFIGGGYALMKHGKGAKTDPQLSPIGRFLNSGWSFDSAYQHFFLTPYSVTSRANRLDVIDLLYKLIGLIARFFNLVLSRTQDGLVRHYALGMGFGAVIILILFLK